MNIIFRVDSHKNIGAGHAMRCIALAEEFIRHNCKVCFIYQNQFDFIINSLTEKGITKLALAKDISASEEIKVINQTLKMNYADILILDGYNFDLEYQKRLKECGVKICYITDFPVEHCADILVCPTPGLYSTQFVSINECSYFLGCEYVFLRDEIINTLKNTISEARQNLKILVAFGASFFDIDIIKKIINFFETILQKIEVNFIVGINSEENKLLNLINGKKNKYYFTTAKNFTPSIMAEADFALTTASTMFWELNFLNVPAVIFFVSDNQKGNAEWLKKNNIALSAGDLKNCSERELELICKAYILNIMNGYKIKKIIDGKGKTRILEEIIKIQKCGRGIISEN